MSFSKIINFKENIVLSIVSAYLNYILTVQNSSQEIKGLEIRIARDPHNNIDKGRREGNFIILDIESTEVNLANTEEGLDFNNITMHEKGNIIIKVSSNENSNSYLLSRLVAGCFMFQKQVDLLSDRQYTIDNTTIKVFIQPNKKFTIQSQPENIGSGFHEIHSFQVPYDISYSFQYDFAEDDVIEAIETVVKDTYDNLLVNIKTENP